MKLSGKWLSTYEYASGANKDTLQSQHVVLFTQDNDQLIGGSESDASGSQLSLRLRLDGRIATGTWSEKTSETGSYKGAVFHGAIQLLITEDGRAMRGQWLGFNASQTRINHGNWQLIKVG